MFWGCGGTGRRARLRGVFFGMWVQVPPSPPKNCLNTNVFEQFFLKVLACKYQWSCRPPTQQMVIFRRRSIYAQRK